MDNMYDDIYSVGIKYNTPRSGLAIRVFVKFAVGRSDKQHINKECANLTGEECYDRF